MPGTIRAVQSHVYWTSLRPITVKTFRRFFRANYGYPAHSASHYLKVHHISFMYRYRVNKEGEYSAKPDHPYFLAPFLRKKGKQCPWG